MYTDSWGCSPPTRNISRKHWKALMRENTSAKNKEYHIWGMVTNWKACAAEAPSTWATW